MKNLPARFLLLAILLGFAPAARSATIVYAVTANGLLFRSTDAAKTWQPVPIAGAPVPAAQPALAVDPKNSSILYLSLRAGGKVRPGGSVGGIFRSADGGATWSQPTLPSTVPPSRLAVDPTSSNIVYSGSETGAKDGFFRSIDSGATWSAATLTDPIKGIGTDPHQPGIVYASTDHGVIYKSTDSGITWTTLTSNPGFAGQGAIYDLAVDPNNSSVLYAPGAGGAGCPGMTNCGVFQSADGGKTWGVISALKGAFNNVVIDSRNGNIYAAGVDPSGPSPLVFKSADGAKTWAPIINGMTKRVGAEVHLDPEVATTLYAGQATNLFGGNTGPGGGVYVSTDSGASWTLSPVDAAAGANDVVLAMAVVSSIVGAPAPPAISAHGVVNAASSDAGIVANSWVTIFGTNLASKTDNWNHSIVNGKLPTSLDGVSVSIGGKPGYINYISPTQINLLAPDIAAGPVSLTVTDAGGTTVPDAVVVSPYSPAFFPWPNHQPVATRQDFSYAAKAGTFSGKTTVPAKPGDVLILWGTGFGPTNPVAPVGVPTPGDKTYSTATKATVTIHGVAAPVYGTALAPGSAGLYQVAIQVPTAIADGDWEIQATIGGAKSPTGVLLTVHH